MRLMDDDGNDSPMGPQAMQGQYAQAYAPQYAMPQPQYVQAPPPGYMVPPVHQYQARGLLPYTPIMPNPYVMAPQMQSMHPVVAQAMIGAPPQERTHVSPTSALLLVIAAWWALTKDND